MILSAACFETVTTEGAVAESSQSGASSNEGFIKKLETIIIPQLQFHEVSLTDAVEFLRVKSRQLDADNKQPLHINFTLRCHPDTIRISLDLKKVSLIEALGRITEAGGVEFRIQDQDIVIEYGRHIRPQLPSPPDSALIRAQQIILPAVQIEKASLKEALTYLKTKARDTHGQTITIPELIIKPNGDADSGISLDLKDVPLHIALKYIAALAGYTIVEEGITLVFIPTSC
jgi:hypothetical protein